MADQSRLNAGGTMGERIREKDWDSTPFGSPNSWDKLLHDYVRMVDGMQLPAVICWGKELSMIHNSAYRSLLGENQDTLGQPFLKSWSGDNDQIPLLVDKALAGEAISFSNHILQGNNTKKEPQGWFDFYCSPLRDDSGSVNGILAIAVEKTQHLDIQHSLRRSEERYQTVFDSIDEGFCIIEMIFDEENAPVDYRFLEVNASFEKQTGIENPEGKRRRQLQPELDDDWYEIFGSVALTGHPVRFERPVEAADKCYNVYAFPFGEPESHKLGVLFNDITKRKHAEKELKEINETLEERVEERTQALTAYQDQLRRLASELSRVEEHERQRIASELHDNLGQMLAACKIRLDTLEKNQLSEETLNEIADVTSLVKEALVYTRELMTDLKPPPALDKQGNIKEVLRWVGKKMSDLGLEVTIEDDGQPKPLGNDIQTILHKCVRELLINVIEHAQVKEAKIRLLRIGEAVQVAVEDKGQGFKKEKLKQAQSGDSGLGLFNIREQLHFVGADFTITSEPGKGTKATIVIPLDHEAKPDAMRSTDDQPDTEISQHLQGEELRQQEKIRILLVDDHKMVRKGLRKMIEQQEDMMIVAEASAGEEAIHLAFKTNPDVILMDVNLPGIDGIEATRQIIADFPHIHIIGLSLHDREQVAKDMRKAGASAYLTKSEAFESLCATIRNQNVTFE